MFVPFALACYHADVRAIVYACRAKLFVNLIVLGALMMSIQGLLGTQGSMSSLGILGLAGAVLRAEFEPVLLADWDAMVAICRCGKR